jgi:pyruvate dehydrogenase E2 component (dihydrolipoamide acetyltransferase)
MARYHAQMFADAREGKIKPEYVQGGTFLVSNLGAYGVDSFSAIIDSPQSGALAVGAAQLVPVVLKDGTIGVGNRMKSTLSIDHRISDGAEGAQFMQYYKELIENPMRLLV